MQLQMPNASKASITFLFCIFFVIFPSVFSMPTLNVRPIFTSILFLLLASSVAEGKATHVVCVIAQN